MAVQIPIQPNVSSQTFDIALNGVAYSMAAKWNSRAEYWALDIFDSVNDPLVLGICLKLGARLLSQFNLDIGELIIVDDSSAGIEADLSNIGTSTHLVYFTPDEVAGLLV